MSSVIILGGTGFLGSYLQVTKNFEFEKFSINVEDCFYLGSKDFDLRDIQQVKSLYRIYKPSIIINLASNCGGIGYNQKNPFTLLDENLTIGMNLIREAIAYGKLDKFVQLGSVCSYPKYAKSPFKEEEMWDGMPEETNAGYGEAKRALWLALKGAKEQFGLNGIFLVPVNLYGIKDNFGDKSHVIPALIKKFYDAKKNNADVIVWGTGNATREFLNAGDCARAIWLATEKYNSIEPVNIGTGEFIKINDLANLIGELIGFKGNIVFDASKPDGQPHRCLSTDKAEKLFGFKAETSLRDGLKRVIDWYIREQ